MEARCIALRRLDSTKLIINKQKKSILLSFLLPSIQEFLAEMKNKSLN